MTTSLICSALSISLPPLSQTKNARRYSVACAECATSPSQAQKNVKDKPDRSRKRQQFLITVAIHEQRNGACMVLKRRREDRFRRWHTRKLEISFLWKNASWNCKMRIKFQKKKKRTYRIFFDKGLYYFKKRYTRPLYRQGRWIDPDHDPDRRKDHGMEAVSQMTIAWRDA